MSEEDLELLITLDDPEGAPEEDTFNHLQPNAIDSLRQGSSRTNEQKALDKQLENEV